MGKPSNPTVELTATVLKELGIRGMLDRTFPNASYKQVLCDRDPERHGVVVFFDMSISGPSGDFDPLTKHFAASFLMPDKDFVLLGARELVDKALRLSKLCLSELEKAVAGKESLAKSVQVFEQSPPPIMEEPLAEPAKKINFREFL